jgi:hypothetical protein
MNKLTPAILFIATMAGSVSCKKETIGDGPVSTETRNVTSFTSIDLQMNGNVYYTTDPVSKIEITAKESIHAMLETKVINNRLVIRYSNGKTYDEDESIRIAVFAPAVNRFDLNSSGSIYSMNAIQQSTITVHSNGSGNIQLQHIQTDYLDVESNVSGRITIFSGTATQGTVKTDASGKIDLSGIAAKKINARTIGSGDIKVKVSEQLDARIDGSGSIYFSGYPFVRSDISGSGKLIHL